jgi:hypothetical protein
LSDYYKIASDLNAKYPCVKGDIKKDNLPGFRRNKHQSPEKPSSNLSCHSTVKTNSQIPDYICNIPISTSVFNFTSESQPKTTACSCLHHQPSVANSLHIQSFDWVVSRFGSGAFFSACKLNKIPFNVTLAADTTLKGRSLLSSYGQVPHVVEGSYELISILKSSTTTYQGYFVTAPWSIDEKEENIFFNSQITIEFIFSN